MAEPRVIELAIPAAGRITSEDAAEGIRAVFRLFELWGLTTEQGRVLLGQPSPATFYRWKAGDIRTVPHDCAWRVGDLLGIHKALRYLFAKPTRAQAWIRKPKRLSAVSQPWSGCSPAHQPTSPPSGPISTPSARAGEHDGDRRPTARLPAGLGDGTSDHRHHLPARTVVRGPRR